MWKRSPASAKAIYQFARAWSLNLRPSLSEFLASIPEAEFLETALELVRIDIEWRVLAGEVPPLTPSYASMDVLCGRLTVSHLKEFATLELTSRWHCGQPVTREIVGSFLAKEAELELPSDIPRWTCPTPGCTTVDIQSTIPDRDSITCPHCHTTHKIDDLIRPNPSLWHKSNAPEWLCRAVVTGTQIGEGAYGTILQITDTALFDRPIAIKLLKRHHSSNPHAVEGFEQECQIISALQHGNVPPIHSHGVLPSGEHFYTLRLIEGRTLEELLAERANCEDPSAHNSIAEDALKGVARAIAYAHDKRIIHRDIKPSNILIGKLGEIFVLDWGIATFAGQSPSFEKATVRGQGAGTWAYISPGQARGAIATPAADVFSLGAILLEVLTGSTPWGNNKSPIEVIKANARAGNLAAADECLKRIEQHGSWSSEKELIAACRAMLSQNEEVQLKTGAEVLERLEAWERARAERVRSLAATEARTQEAERGRVIAEVAQQKTERAKKIAVGLAALLGCLAVVLALSAFWISSERDRANSNAEVAKRESDKAAAQEKIAEEKALAAIQAENIAKLAEGRARMAQSRAFLETGKKHVSEGAFATALPHLIQALAIQETLATSTALPVSTQLSTDILVDRMRIELILKTLPRLTTLKRIATIDDEPLKACFIDEAHTVLLGAPYSVLWKLADNSLHPVDTIHQTVSGFSINPTHFQLAPFNDSSSFGLIDLTNNADIAHFELPETLPESSIQTDEPQVVAWSDRGNRVVALSNDGTAVWIGDRNADSPEPAFRTLRGPVNASGRGSKIDFEDAQLSNDGKVLLLRKPKPSILDQELPVENRRPAKGVLVGAVLRLDNRSVPPLFINGQSRPVLSPDGHRIAVADQTGLIHIVATDTQKQHALFGIRPGVHPEILAFDRHGLTLATISKESYQGAPNTLEVWSMGVDGKTKPGERLALRQFALPITKITFSPAKNALAIAMSELGTTSYVQVWDSGLTLPLTPPMPHKGDITTLGFDISGENLLTATTDGVLKVYNLVIPVIDNARIPALPQANGLALQQPPIPNLKTIATSADGLARITENHDGEFYITKPLQHTPLPGSAGAAEFAFSPNARWLLGRKTQTSEILLWDISAPQAPPRTIGKSTNLCFDATSEHVAIWDAHHNAVQVHSLGSQGEVILISAFGDDPNIPDNEDPSIMQCWLSHNGDLIAVSRRLVDGTGQLSVFDVATKQRMFNGICNGTEHADDMTWSDDGKWIALRSDNALRVVPLDTAMAPLYDWEFDKPPTVRFLSKQAFLLAMTESEILHQSLAKEAARADIITKQSGLRLAPYSTQLIDDCGIEVTHPFASTMPEFLDLRFNEIMFPGNRIMVPGVRTWNLRIDDHATSRLAGLKDEVGDWPLEINSRRFGVDSLRRISNLYSGQDISETLGSHWLSPSELEQQFAFLRSQPVELLQPPQPNARARWHLATIKSSPPGQSAQIGLASIKAIATTADRPEHWARLGWTHLELGSPKDAVDAFKQAAALDHTDPPSLMGWLAAAYVKSGQIDEAVSLIEKYAHIPLKGETPWQIEYALGLVNFALGNTKEATDHFARVRSGGFVMNEMGVWFAAHGESEKALERFRAATSSQLHCFYTAPEGGSFHSAPAAENPWNLINVATAELACGRSSDLAKTCARLHASAMYIDDPSLMREMTLLMLLAKGKEPWKTWVKSVGMVRPLEFGRNEAFDSALTSLASLRESDITTIESAELLSADTEEGVDFPLCLAAKVFAAVQCIDRINGDGKEESIKSANALVTDIELRLKKWEETQPWRRRAVLSHLVLKSRRKLSEVMQRIPPKSD